MDQKLKDTIRELANSKEASEMMRKAACGFMPESLTPGQRDGG